MKDFPLKFDDLTVDLSLLKIVKPAKCIRVFEAINMAKEYAARAKAFQAAAQKELRSKEAGSSRRADELELKALRLADCAQDLTNACELTISQVEVAA